MLDFGLSKEVQDEMKVWEKLHKLDDVDVVLIPFLQLFEDRYTGILIADAVGIGVVVLFASIDWGVLIKQRKFKLVKPKIWRF